MGRALESHLTSYKRKSSINEGASVSISQTFICGLTLTEHSSQYLFTHSSKHILFYLFQRKNENKKQYTLEIEGAMVKRQLQTWINCIMSSVVTLFPAPLPQ